MAFSSCPVLTVYPSSLSSFAVFITLKGNPVHGFQHPDRTHSVTCYPSCTYIPASRQNTPCYLLPFLYIDSSIQTEHTLLPVNLSQIFGSLSPFGYCEYQCFYEAFVYKKLFILLKNLSLLICLNQYVKI